METENIKILLVDDEPDILDFMGYNLRKENYIVFTSTNGKEGIEIAIKEKPHLIILDVMMPEMDGIETCYKLKEIPELSKTLIVFLTARNEDYSLIAGYDAGADDYISKPVKPKVLLSKIKAILKRYNFGDSEINKESVVNIADLIIDKEKYVVIKNGEEFTLSKKEFDLLVLLTSKPDKVFTRDEIYEKVWGNDVIVGERTIDVHIRRIREKLDISNISTVKGVGYKFEI
ncbi:MAG: response regulator transcription factor [Bacteroidota bacterium]|nr:response regulator transcription factor [Bacteroidota bacterium]